MYWQWSAVAARGEPGPVVLYLFAATVGSECAGIVVKQTSIQASTGKQAMACKQNGDDIDTQRLGDRSTVRSRSYKNAPMSAKVSGITY